MADYKLTNTDMVIRTADNAGIPNDPNNRDRIEYDAWLYAGGVPDPYVAPEMPPPAPSLEQSMVVELYEHENRLRVIEGQPPITLQDYFKKMTAAK
jgi:hypothetical protein